MTQQNTTSASISHHLDDVLSALRDGRRILEGGRLTDLTGLDGRVEAICRDLASLPPSEAEAFLPALSAVAEELAAIEAECRRRREDIAPSHGPAESCRAASAYRKRQPDDF